MNWFERLTGFTEGRYDETKAKLAVEGHQLRSLVNGRSYGIGQLELVSLQSLRERVAASKGLPGRLKISTLTGDVGPLHGLAEHAGALFQVASQFNMLEMPRTNVTPEDGVTAYESDATQGPACAMAAGAATLYRNYFAPVGDQEGQTAKLQLDGLRGLGESLSSALGVPVASLWQMRNGYALASKSGLELIISYLGSLSESAQQALAGELVVGLHSDVEVTGGQLVSQLFCSALPVAYTRLPGSLWARFASLILDAAYEATLLAGVLNAQRGASNVVLLTRLGGRAFGNDARWIDGAMRRAAGLARAFALDVRIVSYSEPTPEELQLVRAFQ